MGVVNEEVATESSGCVVIYATGPIGDVAHDESLCAWAEAGKDVRYGGGEEEKTFGELESDLLGIRRPYSIDCFVDFEGVVGWEKSNGGINMFVVQYFW